MIFSSPAQTRRGLLFILLLLCLNFNVGLTHAVCNNPTPRFRTMMAFNIGSATGSVVVGDFGDPDGIPDLAMITAVGSGGAIGILFGNGTGTYTSTGTYINLGTELKSIRAGDFDGDGTPNDLAVLDGGSFSPNTNGSLSLLRYNETTDQYVNNNYSLVSSGSIHPTAMAVGRFGSDIYTDIAVVDGSQTVYFVNVDSNGVQVTPTTYTSPSTFHPVYIESGDFDDDGVIDLVAGTVAADTPYPGEPYSRVTLLLNSGAGFGIGSTFDTEAHTLSSLTVGDVNLDDNPDVVAANGSSNSLSIFLSDGNGALTLEPLLDTGAYGSPTPSNRNPYRVIVGDFNGDTNPDLVSADSTMTVSVFVGDGTGAFVSPQTTALARSTSSFATGDLNKDGKPDLALTFSTEAGTLLNGFNEQAITKTDFNGDGRTDFAVFRPSNSTWYMSYSYFNTTSGYAFGASGDQPLPGDFDGDRITDFAVFRPSTGVWYVFKSTNSTLLTQTWGTSGDIPVPGDYDGDQKTDFAVFRPSNNTWYIVNSSGGPTRSEVFGSSGDKTVQADYDGDGKTDIAVYRPSTNTWYITRSSDATLVSEYWGTSGDLLVPGNYDCDAKADVAVWRPGNSTWYIKKSTDSNTLTYQVGTTGDIPQPGDYDGDGKTDAAVWRTGNSTWYVIKSFDGQQLTQAWGASGDVPVSSAYLIQ